MPLTNFVFSISLKTDWLHNDAWWHLFAVRFNRNSGSSHHVPKSYMIYWKIVNGNIRISAMETKCQVLCWPLTFVQSIFISAGPQCVACCSFTDILAKHNLLIEEAFEWLEWTDTSLQANGGNIWWIKQIRSVKLSVPSLLISARPFSLSLFLCSFMKHCSDWYEMAVTQTNWWNSSKNKQTSWGAYSYFLF